MVLLRTMLIAAAWLAWPAMASMHENIGYQQLADELGDAVPRGRGLTVTQVESAMSVDHDRNPATAKIRSWRPNLEHRALRDADVVLRKADTLRANSGHATGVAQRLVGSGRDKGLATAARLEVQAVADWLGRGQLNFLSPHNPSPGEARVLNHSWATGMDTPRRGGQDTRVLRRADWLVERDEVVMVVGVRNNPRRPNDPLLAAAHNVIVVGRSDGGHSRSTPPVDALYTGGRTRPHLVAPLKTSSVATPVVASAALLLAETAADPALSTSKTPLRTRAGLEVTDAGRPEVLRAVLMAGARRATTNRDYADITDYRARPQDRTDNGLDVRFGAGQLDVYNAWRILAAGEHEAGQPVPSTGFDYAGLSQETATASYRLAFDAPGRLAATLSWHVLFPGAGAERFDASAELNDLDLCLYRLDEDGRHLVSASRGAGDSTENLYASVAAGEYLLVVEHAGRDNAAMAIGQDYGLAWQWLPARQ